MFLCVQPPTPSYVIVKAHSTAIVKSNGREGNVRVVDLNVGFLGEGQVITIQEEGFIREHRPLDEDDSQPNNWFDGILC